jgi:DNA-binding NarL/FixJ family response regulator
MMHEDTHHHRSETTDTRVRVLLIAPDDLVTESLRRALDLESDLQIVGRVDTSDEIGDDLTRAITRHDPAVMVVTAEVHDNAGLVLAGRLREEHPDVPVVLLADTASGPALVSALAAGCAGFVAWDSCFTELVLAVRTAARGGVHVPVAMAEDLAAHLQPEPRSRFDLTDRELEVLALLARGRSTEEIVAELTVSVHTVRNHVRAILAKLGAHSRLEAVAIATRRGLVSAQPESALR